jgi:Putative Actinobacterial Holin-X, holin superfamily III/Protein of unknown function (DUF3618)
MFRLSRSGVRSAPSFVELVRNLVSDGRRLVRVEIELVKARFAQALRQAGIGIAALLVAAILLLLGAAGLLVTAGLALAIVLPGWAAGLIVAATLLLTSAVAGLLGRSQLRAAVRARMSGPVDLETELQETRHRLEDELEAISSRLDPRRRAHNAEDQANGHSR